ncbi:MAG: type II toxin-antitoxin system RelE/ParE family toxin [Bacteroidia bacterium]
MKVQEKIDFILFILETQIFIPQKYVKHITGSEGIYEVRVSVGSNEHRILFFFEEGDLISGGKIIILGNAFVKKDNKDYKKAVVLAEKIKEEYFEAMESEE